MRFFKKEKKKKIMMEWEESRIISNRNARKWDEEHNKNRGHINNIKNLS